MSRFSFFGKHLAISIALTALCSVLGLLSFITIRQVHRENSISPMSNIIARLLAQTPREARVAALESSLSSKGGSRYQFWLLDENKNILYPKEAAVLPLNLEGAALPDKIFDFKSIDDNKNLQPPYTLIRLDNESPQYLLVSVTSRNNGRVMFFTNFAALAVSALLGTTLSLLLLFYTLREKARLADSVISELQGGNLKARFPIKKMDEIGQAMVRFNRMADEIERLVERLKTTEKSRMSILQELAHDLRTPVASLKSMLETLSSSASRTAEISPAVKEELFSLSLKEVDYFANLVEDLLFLAQASEPRYNHHAESVDLTELIEAEAESCEKADLEGREPIQIRRDFHLKNPLVRGDRHLLRRLFRNALENAISFAKAQVTVSLRHTQDGRVECVIHDDGPGFTAEGLTEFGRRKMSRRYNPEAKRRASIGLGSVIMSTSVALHRGEIRVANRTDSGGKILGAEVSVVLPLS